MRKNPKESKPPIADPLSIFRNMNDVYESMNYMKYQFFIDFPVTMPTDISEELNKKIGLMHKRMSGSLSIDEDIFGLLLKSNDIDENKRKAIEKLRILENIHELTYQHCIISCLHTVKFLLHQLEEKYYYPTTASHYVTINKLDPDETKSSPGFFVLSHMDDTKNKSQNNKLKITDLIPNPIDEKSYHQKYYRYNDKNNFGFAQFVLGRNSSFEKNDYRIPGYNFDFYNHVYSNARIWESLNANYMQPGNNRSITAGRFAKFIENYQKFGNPSIFHTTKNQLNEKAKVDYILLQYQIERYFNPHLLNYLFTSLPVDAPKDYPEFWQRFMALPNVFSREKLVNIALFSLQVNRPYHSYKNKTLSMDKMYEALYSISGKRDQYPIHDKAVRNSIWIDAVSYGLTYLSKVYYPFYEKYLFLYLYNIFLKNNSKNFQKEKEVLIKMMDYLFNECSKLDVSLSYSKINQKNFVHRKQYLDTLHNIIYHKNPIPFFQTTYSKEYFGILDNIPYSYSMGTDKTDLQSFHQLMLEYKIKTIIATDDILNTDKE